MSSEIVVQPLHPAPTTRQEKTASQAVTREDKHPRHTEPASKAGTNVLEFTPGNYLPKTGEDSGELEPLQNQVGGQSEGNEAEAEQKQDQVNEVVRNLNDLAQNMRRELKFSVDEETGRTVVKVLDQESKELIRQIPAEEVLELARIASENNDNKGNIFRQEV